MELLVVIFIISTITSLVLINYRAAGSSQALNRSAQKLAFYIRKAQILSLSGVNFTDQGPNKLCAYGIHLETADQSKNQIFNLKECNGNKIYNNDPIIEQIQLESGVNFASFTPISSYLDIIFIPPKPEIFINNSNIEPAGSITISLTNNPSQTKIITITNKGQVSINNN